MGITDPFKQNLKFNTIDCLYKNFDPLFGDRYAIGIARNIEWQDNKGLTNSNYRPIGKDSFGDEVAFWRYAIGFKLVTKTDISKVIKNWKWQSGEIYTPYRNELELFDDGTKFYVVVDNARVYKCIDNNYDSPSTYAPLHTDPEIRTLADGYRWKFLFEIPETKKDKFLTTSTNEEYPGYIPVETIKFLKKNDERQKQWDVQQAAITGSIDHIALDNTSRQYVISDRVVFSSSNNQVISATSAGSQSVIIGGTNLVYLNDYYNNMIWKVDSGLGEGQQRVISNYTINGNSTATITLETPLNIGVTSGTGSNASYYSILPNIKVYGDGSSNNNTLNTYLNTAELTVKFQSTGPYGATGPRYLESISVANSGKNYSYAYFDVVRGLTFTAGYTGISLNDILTPVIAPYGGHGSDPEKELGCKSLMIAIELNEDDNSRINANNDYRQFSLLRNLRLSNPFIKLTLDLPGSPSSFTVNNIVTQSLTGLYGLTGFTGAMGKVVSWTYGATGTTNTSELVLNSLTGEFKLSGKIGSFGIVDIFHNDVIGTEGRLLSKLKVVPTGSSFSLLGNDFTINYFAFGCGNTSQYIRASNANGRIYDWEIEDATNTSGYLYLTNPQGQFIINENLKQMYGNNQFTNTVGKITEIDTTETPYQTAYSQLYKVKLAYNGTDLFTSSSINKDDFVRCLSGSSVIGSGYCVDWQPGTGNTQGSVYLNYKDGNYTVGNKVLYNTTKESTIIQIQEKPEIIHNSGEILHLQNLRYITRNADQKEEIKFVIEY